MSDGNRIEAKPHTEIGKLKWYSSSKGFGFLICPELNQDVLLHEKELGEFARSVLVPEAEIEFLYIVGNQGPKVTEIVSVSLSLTHTQRELAAELKAIPLVPACVKWYDVSKGFGFANAFGEAEDIFLHAALLSECGRGDLVPGEAISLRCKRTERGKIAVDIRPWESVF